MFICYEYLKNIFHCKQICFAQENNHIKRHYACEIAVYTCLAGVHEHDEPPPISEIATNDNFSTKLDIVQTLLGRESLDLHRQH